MSKRVAIIGGGPVGLMCAILLTERCNAEVDVYEQRSRYTRKQVLVLDRNSIERIVPLEVVERLRSRSCFVKPPRVDSEGKCYRSGRLPLAVPIALLEEELLRYAKSLGVKIVRPRSGKRQPVRLRDLQGYDIIVGASGRNDQVRRTLNGRLGQRKVSDAAIFTWTSKEKYPIFNRSYSHTSDGSQSRYRLFRNADGESMYGVIQLTKDEAKRLENVERAQDITDEDLQDAVESMLRYYSVKDVDSFYDDARVSLVPISVYQARQVAGMVDDVLMVAIGDAVVGVNFFSGLGVNTGFKMASLVAEAICADRPNAETVRRLNKEIAQVMDEATERSERVLLRTRHALSRCSRATIAELRDLARRYKYRGVSTLPKQEMCFVMAEVL